MTDDRELDVGRSKELGTIFIDVINPFVMVIQCISRDTNDLYATLLKVRDASGDLSELSGADRSEVRGVREQDAL